MEPKPTVTFESDDFRLEGERLSAAINGFATYMIVLDEKLPPWGARLAGNCLYLGSEAKAHNYRHCHNTTNPELN